MRVVLDTNVIISALNFPGNEPMVLELALRGRFEFYLSLFILEEVAGVLTRKFGWDEQRTAQGLKRSGELRHRRRTPTIDRSDRRRPRRQPGPGVRGGRSRRLPGDRRPEASTAHRGTSGNDDCQRSPVSVGAGAGPIGGGYLARPDH